jgi:hypothetical protein
VVVRPAREGVEGRSVEVAAPLDAVVVEGTAVLRVVALVDEPVVGVDGVPERGRVDLQPVREFLDAVGHDEVPVRQGGLEVARGGRRLRTVHHRLVEHLERDGLRLSLADAADDLVVEVLVDEALPLQVDDDRALGVGVEQPRLVPEVLGEVRVVLDGRTE